MNSRAARGKARKSRPVKVAVFWVASRRPLTDPRVRKIARAALAFGKRPDAPISIVFVDDAELARMHGRWLADPRPTDVISFDLGEADGGPVGELYISVQRARAQARRRGVRVERELALYIVHGCLHLCGFDDRAPRDRRAMRNGERSVLGELGFEEDPTSFE